MSDWPTIQVQLFRYRCFTEESNAVLRLEPGKTVAIVGKNNSGKSTLLRFFYEMRPCLADLHNVSWSGIGESESWEDSPKSFNAMGNTDLVDELVVFPFFGFQQASKIFSLSEQRNDHVFAYSPT